MTTPKKLNWKKKIQRKRAGMKKKNGEIENCLKKNGETDAEERARL